MIVPATLLAACSSSSPLSEVEVVGGSASQRRTVREVVAAFDVATGGAVRLRAIRFEASLGGQNGFDVAGRYRADHVLLLDTLVGDELRRVTGHELCHALDDDLGLSDARTPELDDLRSVILDGEADDRSGVHERREVLSRLCERGGPVASLLSVPSPDLPESGRRVFDDLRQAFVGSALPAASPDEGDEVRSAVHFRAERFSASARSDRVVKLTWDFEHEAWLDQWSGVPVEPPSGTWLEHWDEEEPWGSEPMVRVCSDAEGRRVGGSVTLTWDLIHSVVRYVLPGDPEWLVLEDPVAPLGHSQAWAGDGWFWVASDETEQTTWTPFRP